MALSLQEMASQLQARLEPKSEKLSDLSNEVLMERHTTLKAEREAMPDTDDPQKRAAVTNKVKRIEGVLRERGVDFEPLAQANQPLALTAMTDEQISEEFAELQVEYANPSTTAGRRSGITVRYKAMFKEVTDRQAARTPEATDTVVPDTEAEAPTDAELVEVAATATAVEEPPTRSRRRRS